MKRTYDQRHGRDTRDRDSSYYRDPASASTSTNANGQSPSASERERDGGHRSSHRRQGHEHARSRSRTRETATTIDTARTDVNKRDGTPEEGEITPPPLPPAPTPAPTASTSATSPRHGTTRPEHHANGRQIGSTSSSRRHDDRNDRREASSRDADRHRERERARDRDSDRDRSRAHDRDSTRDYGRERERERDGDRYRHREGDRDRERHNRDRDGSRKSDTRTARFAEDSSKGKAPEAASSASLKPAEEEEEIDYDSLYAATASATAAKAAPRKTAAELLEEKRLARAAILARHHQEKERSMSATPQPDETLLAPGGLLHKQGLGTGTPGTPATLSAGINSAIGKLQVEGTASPDKPKTGNADTAEDSDSEDEGQNSQRRRDEQDLLHLEQNADASRQAPKAVAFAKGFTAAGSAGTPNPRQEEEFSAADYDPENETMFDDRRERERLFMDKNEQKADFSRTAVEHSSLQGQKHAERPVQQTQAVPDPRGMGPQTVHQDADDDDDDDMFAVDKKPKRQKLDSTADLGASKTAYVPVIKRSAGMSVDAASGAGAAPLIVDNFDDAEGYYRVILGETLDGERYHITGNLGKGMFSNVVKARDLQSGQPVTNPDGSESVQYRDVAIKIMRSQESMYRAGQKEAITLKKLAEADPTDKRHVIRLERTFDHRGHLCLVFESLSMNLRDVIKRFGKDVGINLKAVRAYAHQIFLALALFRKISLMHADIKPDNILVNESKSMLKVCDLGSASDTSEAEITPYLVSRFYRAPEIILGLPYDCSLDMWSIGCTLYELYTGKILFPGRSNNHMLYLVQDLKGRYPGRLVKKSKFGDIHFEDSNFVFVEKNKSTGAESIKKMVIPGKASSDLRNRLMPPSVIKKLPEDEVKLLGNFVNLLDRALELDPSKRLTPKEALNHPFLR